MGAQIVLGIPGPWKDRTSLLAAIAAANGGGGPPRYLAAGPSMIDLESKSGFEFEDYGANPNMSEAFRIAGEGRLTERELAAIAAHAHTVYLLGEPEDRESVRRMARMAAFLLKAGGLGVKVESSGVAHPPDRWRYLSESASTLSLYRAFCVLVGGREGSYSCGMRTFGLPDVAVTVRVSPREAAEILTAFNHWQLLENPEPREGDLFSTAASDPVFTMRHGPYGYDPQELLNNPFGKWTLDPSASKPALPPPYQGTKEPLFTAIPPGDPELLEGVRSAQKSLGSFLRHFESPFEYGRHLFKVRVVDGHESALLWLALTEVRENLLVGRLFEVPPEFKGHRPGQSLEMEQGEIQDWAIFQSGSLIGGWSMRLTRSRMNPELRKAYDLYTGTKSYVPLDDLES
jgi:uncharacterized protein YegJ (DUF2314 family)